MANRRDLRRQDWLTAAQRALIAGGLAAVRIESLAAALSVTKGSFYYHFADRADLLAGLLADWQARADGLLQRLARLGGGPTDKLWALIETVIREGAGSGEWAIRAWALHAQGAGGAPAAKAALALIDAARLRFLQQLFEALGFAPATAEARARLCYLALIAEHQLATEPSIHERLEAARLAFDCLTAPAA